MHLITLKALVEAGQKFPRHKQELQILGKVLEKGFFPTPDSL